MSAERIARLEGLLSRIQSRARGAQSAVVASAATAAVAEEPAAELEVVDDVEVDIDVDDVEEVSESGTHPASGGPDDDYEESTIVGRAAAVEPQFAEPQVSEPPADEPQLEEVIDEPAANEVVEATPSSSRRPIALADEEERVAPRHTPPPESGKQVASSHPPASTSSAPPAEEGHTLIGGWREPGIPGAGIRFGMPAPGRVPGGGVRVPAPPPAPESAPSPPPPPAKISADVSRPALPTTAKVAKFEGVAPVEKPKTFGELLDWTLGL